MRISIETCVFADEVSQPIGTPTHTRRKDRISYSHEECIIDLTQVTSSYGPNAKVFTPSLWSPSPLFKNSPQQTEVLHELEIELARPEYLLLTAAKRGDPSVSEQERNAFDELIRAFVNNARILVRNAGDGWQ